MSSESVTIKNREVVIIGVGYPMEWDLHSYAARVHVSDTSRSDLEETRVLLSSSSGFFDVGWPSRDVLIKKIRELRAVFSRMDDNTRTTHRRIFMRAVRLTLSRYLRAVKVSPSNKTLYECEEFCASALSWVTQYSRIKQHQIDRANIIAKMIANVAKFENCEWYGRFSTFTKYIQHALSIRNEIQHRNVGAITNEIDGLVLYLAATFEGSINWLGEDEICRNALLVSSVFDALRSVTVAFFVCSERLPDAKALSTTLIKEQLKQFGIGIERHNLGKLKACLIRTPFDCTVHLNEQLSREESELACFHELAHHVLGHRSNSEYALDPELLSSKVLKGQFVRQEQEADGFATLWHHVLRGVTDYLLNSTSRTSNLKPQFESDLAQSVSEEILY